MSTVTKNQYQRLRKAYTVGTKRAMNSPMFHFERTQIYIEDELNARSSINKAKRLGAKELGKKYFEMRTKRQPAFDLYDYDGLPRTISQIKSMKEDEEIAAMQHDVAKSVVSSNTTTVFTETEVIPKGQPNRVVYGILIVIAGIALAIGIIAYFFAETLL